MNKYRNKVYALLHLAMGWVMFYAGITKVLDPEWSAAGYLNSANTFSGFYSWLASPEILPVVNFLNEWGLTLIGVALILHIFVRWASAAGALIMLLYYFPALDFPYVGSHSYLIDDHIIYALVFVLFIVYESGEKWWQRWGK